MRPGKRRPDLAMAARFTPWAGSRTFLRGAGEHGKLSGVAVRVEVLGWRAGAPLGGACSSYLVEAGGATVLLDCGPGALALLWERGVLGRLDAVVVSHMHDDHMLDLVPFASSFVLRELETRGEGRGKPRLFVPRDGGLRTLEALEDILQGRHLGRNARARDGVGGPSRAFELSEYGEADRPSIGGLSATFRRTLHPIPCFSPRLTDGLAAVVYSADAAYAPELVDHASGVDLLLCEATFPEDRDLFAREQGHMTGASAGRLAAEAGVGRLALTHLGPYAEQNAEILESAAATFAGPVELASTGRAWEL